MGLGAQLPAPAAGFLAGEVLDHEVDRIGLADDRDLADHLARAGAGGLEHQLDIISRQVARQQQIALGAVTVEHLVFGQLLQIARKLGFGAAGFAPRTDGRHACVEQLQPHLAVLDPLRRHLDRRQIALVAQIGAGPVADFADYRHRMLDAGEIGPGGAHFLRGRALQIVEIDVRDRHPHVVEFGVGQGTGGALDTADDIERRFGGRRRKLRPGQLFPGRGHGLGGCGNFGK